MSKFIRRLLLFLWLPLIPASVLSQNATVRGKVTDTKGTPIAGATVIVKETNKGTITDAKGMFSLSAPKNGNLEISFLGYKKSALPIGGKTYLDIRLEEETTAMDEVIVVGYGTQKKINLTGAVAQIKGDQISNKPSTSVLSALQGEMPGLLVTQQSGQPGEEGMQLQIRGYSSANNVETLVLIDGIEGSLETVNPNDIESISVLKDAASASIYGYKAAGGVVLVTTKQAKAGKVKVSYNGSYSITMQGRMPKRLDSWEEYEIVTRASDGGIIDYQSMEYYKNPNLEALIAGDTKLGYYANTDWVDIGLKSISNMQRHSLSLRGGTKQLSYSLSMGYYKRNGFIKYGPDSNDRANMRLNMTSRLNRYLTVDLKLTGDRSEVKENAFTSKGVMAKIYRSRTRSTVYFPQDEDPIPNGNIYAGQDADNPIDIMRNAGTRSTVNNDFSGQLALTVRNVLPGLKGTFSASRKYRAALHDRKTHQINWYSRGTILHRQSQTIPNGVLKQRDNTYTDLFRGVLDYDRSIRKRHNFQVMAGVEYEHYVLNRMNASKDYQPDGIYSLNFGNAASAKAADEIRESKTQSVFGRFNYNYREKYLLEANLRYDGSSRLAPENRWKLFPSVALGWVVSKERFLRNVKAIDMLKVRASWGQLGNATAIGYYDYIPVVEDGTTIFGGGMESTNYVATLASLQKTWETIEIQNIGLDLALLNQRLQFSGDYYVKRNKNMLSQTKWVPSLIGVNVPYLNVGELKTWGWEFEITWRDRIGKDFNYFVSFNLSDSQNKLVKYEGENIVGEGIVQLLQGYPMNTIWGYRTNGLFQEKPSSEVANYQPGKSLTSAGDVIYVNRDDDPNITIGDGTPANPGDLVVLGTTDPRYTFGLNLGFEWKRFSFSVMLQGVGKRKFLLDEETLNPTAGSLYQAVDFHRDYWTPDNRDAFFPRPVYKGGSYNYKPSDRWIQDGSYIRLKNIQIGYTIPIKKSFIENLNVYVSGDNLYEWTNTWKSFDPEAPAIASSQEWYAFFRSVSFGLNLTF